MDIVLTVVLADEAEAQDVQQRIIDTLIGIEGVAMVSVRWVDGDLIETGEDEEG